MMVHDRYCFRVAEGILLNVFLAENFIVLNIRYEQGGHEYYLHNSALFSALLLHHESFFCNLCFIMKSAIAFHNLEISGCYWEGLFCLK